MFFSGKESRSFASFLYSAPRFFFVHRVTHFSLGAKESALKMHAYARWKMSKLRAVWCLFVLTEAVSGLSTLVMWLRAAQYIVELLLLQIQQPQHLYHRKIIKQNHNNVLI